MANHHLEDEDPECPPVHGHGVPDAQDDLWRHVVRGAALGPGSGGDLLGEPEVSDDDVPLLVKQDVLGLEVPVGNGEGVEVLQCTHYLSRVE